MDLFGMVFIKTLIVLSICTLFLSKQNVRMIDYFLGIPMLILYIGLNGGCIVNIYADLGVEQYMPLWWMIIMAFVIILIASFKVRANRKIMTLLIVENALVGFITINHLAYFLSIVLDDNLRNSTYYIAFKVLVLLNAIFFLCPIKEWVNGMRMKIDRKNAR